MDRGAAEFFRRHRLVGDGLHHVRAGHEHVARVAHHEDEIGHRWRIDVAARARAHDHGNLRDDARGEHVALEHLAVAAQRRHALLDARAARVEQADDGRAVAQRHVLDLGDLLRVGFRQRAAEHREILGEHVDHAPVHRAPAGDDAIAGDLVALVHAEIGAAVLHEHVVFLEGIMVEQKLDALARGQLAALVLRVDARLPAAQPGVLAAQFEGFEDVFHAGGAFGTGVFGRGLSMSSTAQGWPECDGRRGRGRREGRASWSAQADHPRRAAARISPNDEPKI